MASLTTEGFLMGGQHGKVGARIVVSSLLATSLALSVLAMAPAANAVETPMCENIGQPAVIGTATETGARFTWDNVGDYAYEVNFARWNIAAYDYGPNSDWIDLGSVHEYVVPWSQDGVVTDMIAATIYLVCDTDNSLLLENETITVTNAIMRLLGPKVYRKTTVTNAAISNGGQMKASIRTKLKKGSPVLACVYELVDAEADKWNEKSCKKAKVKKGGKASIKVKGVKDGNWVAVHDAKDRLLVQWGASGGSKTYF